MKPPTATTNINTGMMIKIVFWFMIFPPLPFYIVNARSPGFIA